MADKKKTGILLAEKVLRKRYPGSNLASKIGLSDDQVIKLPSSNLSLNYQIGGGIPYGKIMEPFGEESTGKTLLALDFAKVAQLLGGIALWVDAEACWSNAWAIKNGLDLDKIELLPDENVVEIISDWIADMCIYYRAIFTNNEPIFLGVDSTAVLESQIQMDVADTDSSDAFSRRSKMISQMLRKRKPLFAKYGVCAMFINQLRKKIGATKWEDPDTTPGGQSMKFYADIRLGLYRGKAIKNADDKKVGQFVYMRVKKNKTAPPRESIQTKVYFKKTKGVIGYDKYFGLQETLVECGVVERRKGPRYYFEGDLIAHGDLAFMKAIKNDDTLRAKLIAASPINTISKTRKKIEELTKNLYPVKLKAKTKA